jgi:hypothetical protein
MRALLCAVAVGATVFLAGCDSLPSRVQDRFSAVPARTQIVAGSQREVFYAAQGALKRLDFQLSRTAEAQGIVNGFSRIRAGDGPRESRQYTLEIRLNGLGPAETEVSVLVREQIEGGVTVRSQHGTRLSSRCCGGGQVFAAARREKALSGRNLGLLPRL